MDSTVKYLVAAAIAVAGVQTTHGRTAGAGTNNRKVADAPNQHQPRPPKTEDDYVIPRQAWLTAHHSPLDARAIYEIAEKSYHLDSDFVIAVAFAETNGGTVSQRGSSETNPNYWSLCSYDQTSGTCSFQSQAQALDFFGRTLNNPLLGKYRTVGQLSRAGNCCGSVYATSQLNWHRNVLAVMNALKGQQRGDYEFRK